MSNGPKAFTHEQVLAEVAAAERALWDAVCRVDEAQQALVWVKERPHADRHRAASDMLSALAMRLRAERGALDVARILVEASR